ncbi:uncharacterized protein CEXT_364431 [Caerostris extrusa]|uniref:Uncharacterized protein n=1 Tax=Caerostris extrusa TaxID=172846 RepID=A0AAV4M6E4_CAEEX|nr:uncharacterized protein CEXT_364431 [Caerostris extrusa]
MFYSTLLFSATRYEFYIFCESKDCFEDGRLPLWLKFNQTRPKPQAHGEPEEAHLMFTSEMPKNQNLTLSVFIKSKAGIGQPSDFSNKAEVVITGCIESSTTIAPITKDDKKRISQSGYIGVAAGSILIGGFLLLCAGVWCYLYVWKPRSAKHVEDGNKSSIPENLDRASEVSGSFKAVHFRDRNSQMRRVESFPVILYTHDQIKDFKKKVDPPLYRPAIVPKPWMSMNVLSNSESHNTGDSKSLGSTSTVPINDKYKSTEIKQLGDSSQTPEVSQSGKLV